MYKKIIITGCLLAAISVGLGAFGAHGLEKLLTPRMHNVFDTASKYQMYHALAILISGVLYFQNQNKKIVTAFWLFLLGIILFSGSLYALALLSINHGEAFNKIGIITPFGGLFFIAGWFYLVFALSKLKQ